MKLHIVPKKVPKNVLTYRRKGCKKWYQNWYQISAKLVQKLVPKFENKRLLGTEYPLENLYYLTSLTFFTTPTFSFAHWKWPSYKFYVGSLVPPRNLGLNLIMKSLLWWRVRNIIPFFLFISQREDILFKDWILEEKNWPRGEMVGGLTAFLPSISALRWSLHFPNIQWGIACNALMKCYKICTL